MTDRTTPARQQAAVMLGVQADASQEEIRRAYRSMAMQLHPDVGGDAERFREVAGAVESVLAEDARVGDPVAVFQLDHESESGVASWVRQRVQWRTVLLAVVFATLLLIAAALAFPLVSVPTALVLSVTMVSTALYRAVGRPPWRSVVAWIHRPRPGDASEWPTGPIPAMTQERMQQFEQTGR